MSTPDSVTRQAMLAEARRRGWNVTFLGPEDDPDHFYGITNHQGQTAWFRGSLSQSASFMGNFMARHKLYTFLFLEQAGFALPPFAQYTTGEAAEAFLKRHAPIVVKPADAEQSKGVCVDVTTPAQLHEAVAVARVAARRGGVVLQKQLQGKLYRLLAVGDRLFAAAYRRAPFVVGDGVHSVRELIETKNQEPGRGDDSSTPLKKIRLEAARTYLGDEMLERILSAGESLEVSDIASVSAGGESQDVTDDVHADYARAAVEITRKLNLPACGIDILAPDISQPLPDVFPVLEINSGPGFKLHLHPTAGGKSRDPSPALLDAVFARF